METPREHLRKARRKHDEQGLYRRLAGLPLARRRDRLWDGLAVAVVVLLSLGSWIVVRLADPRGELLRPIPDRRWLDDVRQNLPRDPYLAAALHHDRLWVSQGGGRLHRWNPATELWSTLDLDGVLPLAASSEAVDLAQDCSREQIAAGACPRPALWLRTTEGGLARLDERDWVTAFGESSALGAEGEGMEGSDLLTAALSDDREWLMLGGIRGLGMLHRPSRRWIRVLPEVYELLGMRRIEHLRFWRGAFHLGGEGGLFRLVPPSDPRGALDFEHLAEIPGPVVELETEEPAETGSLWVVARPPCETPEDESCLLLVRLDGRGASPVVLLDEGQRIPSLDSGRIRHAQQEGDLLTLAGLDGVVTYDTRLHGWSHLTPLRVRTVRSRPAGELLVGGGGGAARIAGGELIEAWPLPGESIERLVVPGDGRPLALTAQGELFRLEVEGLVTPFYRTSATALDPAGFRRAFPLGRQVIFFGRGGAMLHDTESRTYQDLPQLPAWTRSAELHASRDAVFGLLDQGWKARVLALPLVALAQGEDREVGELPTPVVATDWDGEGLGLIDGAGQLHRATPAGLEPLTGRGLRELELDAVEDVALRPGRELLIATAQGLRSYSYAGRGWDDSWRLTGLGGLRQVETVGTEVVARTARQGLASLGAEDPRFGTESALLVGGQQLSWPPLDRARAARLDSGSLFLASAEAAVRYDPERRRLLASWPLRGRGSGRDTVRILGVQGDERPLVLAQGDLFVGSERVDPAAGRVIDAFYGDRRLWTTRRLDGDAYLAAYPADDPLVGGPVTCLFRRPLAGISDWLDAAEIRPGWVAVAGRGGLWGYDAAARSWHAMRDAEGRPLLPAGGRVRRLGGYLLLEPGGEGPKRLEWIPLGGLPRPGPCDPEPLRIAAGSRRTIGEVLDLAVAPDPREPRVAWSKSDGAIEQWRDGEIQQVAAARIGEPAGQALRRVYRGDQALYFTTREGVYRYRLRDHRWSRHRSGFPERGGEFDLSTVSSPPLVTLRESSGATWVAALEDGEGERARRVLGALSDFVPGPLDPRRLIDVQSWGDSWLFLLDDALLTFDPAARRWSDRLDLARPGPVELRQAAGLRVLERGEDLWIERWGGTGRRLGQRYLRYRPGDDTSFAVAGESELWRLRPDGELLRCRPASDGYRCRGFRAPAPRLAPDRIRQAFELEGARWWVGDDGIQTTAGSPSDSPARLPEALRSVREIERLQRVGDELWLLSAEGMLFRRDAGRRWHDPRRVDRMVVDVAERIWIEADGRWRVWDSRRFEDVEPGERPREGARPGLPDRWPSWRQQVATMPDGSVRFDPILRLETTVEGLWAVRPNDRELLATGRASVGTTPRDALDTGWLRWQRDTRRFALRTPAGMRQFRREELVDRGRLIFERLTTVLAESPERLHAANQHGILTFPSLSCDLSQRDILFRSEELPGRLIAAHGRFLTAEKTIVLFDTGTPLDGVFEDDRTYRVHPFGNAEIVLREHLWEGRIDHHIVPTGGPVFGERGFTWDDRHDLAYQGGNLVVSSAAGVHRWSLWDASFDLAPAGFRPADGSLATGEDGALWARPDGIWRRREGDRWVPSPGRRPEEGIRVRRGGLVWERRGPGLTVRAEAPHHGFDRLRVAAGSGFNADQLRAATIFDGQLFLQSDAFFEIEPSPSGRVGLSARRLGGEPADELFVHPGIPASSARLYRRRGERFDRWNGRGFETVGGDPRERRHLVARLGPLWLEVEGQRLYPSLELSGRRERRAIELGSEGFPFDRVQNVASLGSRLFVQTLGGLEIVEPRSSPTLLPLESAVIYDIGWGDPAPRLGRSPGDPGRLVVRSRDSCSSWRLGSASPEPCPDPDALDRGRIEGEDGLWHWGSDTGGVSGWYRDGPDRAEVELIGGRFLHDRPREIAACGGRAAALWRNGWLSVDRPLDLSLAGGRHTAALADRGPRRLLCLSRPVPRDAGGTLAPGLYVVLADGRLVTLRDGDFAPVEEREDQATLRRQLEDPPLFFGPRLRLVHGRDGFTFEARRDTDEWLPLPWRDGRLPIDHFEDVVARGDDLWLRTPLGFVGFVHAGNELRLDLQGWTWVRGPGDGSLPCGVSDLEDLEQRVVLRCGRDSGRLFVGTLVPGRSAGVFEPYRGDDPFAERTLLTEAETGVWTWTLHDGGQSGAPNVTITSQGRELALTQGRFSFDDVGSLRVRPASGGQGWRWDLATGSAPGGGWYRVLGSDLHLARWRRPQSEVDPAAVRRVVRSRTPTGDSALCIETPDRAVQLVEGETGALESCREHLADDGFWTYSTLGTGLDIRGVARDGSPVSRTLREGRFSDQIARGLPVRALSTSGEETLALVPTEAGILELGDDLYPRGLHHRLEGLDPRRPPRALLVDRAGQVFYLAESRGLGELRSLADGSLHATLRSADPETRLEIVGLEVGPENRWRLRWRNGQQAGTSLVREDLPILDQPYSDRVSMDGWRRFEQGRARWNDPDPGLGLARRSRELRLRHGSGRTHPVTWLGTLEPIAWIPHRESLLVVEPHQLWQLRLDLAAEEMFERPEPPGSSRPER